MGDLTQRCSGWGFSGQEKEGCLLSPSINISHSLKAGPELSDTAELHPGLTAALRYGVSHYSFTLHCGLINLFEPQFSRLLNEGGIIYHTGHSIRVPNRNLTTRLAWKEGKEWYIILT